MILVLVAPAAGQTDDENSIATLYRSSVVEENARHHVATFDADTKGDPNNTVFDHNWGNCLIAAELFQNQPGVRVRYWCEKGRYRE